MPTYIVKSKPRSKTRPRTTYSVGFRDKRKRWTEESEHANKVDAEARAEWLNGVGKSAQPHE